jgi:hypothetical protein
MIHIYSFVYHRCLYNFSSKQRRYITLSINKICSNDFDYSRCIVYSVDFCHSATCISLLDALFTTTNS